MPLDQVPGRPKSRRPARKKVSTALYAAVDLGTNNCRLLIAEPRGMSYRVVDSYAEIARLGEGLNASGRLSDASIERAMAALTKIRSKLKAKGVGHVRCIATEACRKAENGAEFIARVREETGLTFKIIGPKEEAQLALIGCHNLIDRNAERALVVDVGGGSTELSLVNAAKAREAGFKGVLEKPPILDWTSLPLGVVTLSEAFHHLPEAEAYIAMRAHAEDVFRGWKGHDTAAKAMEQGHLIGTSGTVTCLAGLHLNLDKYRRDKVDGVWLAREEAAQAINRLREAGPEGRAAMPTIGPERAGLMLSGCAIIDAAWDVFPAHRLRVADRGLREGLLLSMMHGPKRKRRRGGARRHKSKAKRDDG